MTADLLALLEQDPAAGILAAADLRKQRAKAMGGPWRAYGRHIVEETTACTCAGGPPYGHEPHCGQELVAEFNEDAAEHIAAEANPAHALAAVRRWVKAAERHHVEPFGGVPLCVYDSRNWPCPDLTETADEARAYLGETS